MLELTTGANALRAEHAFGYWAAVKNDRVSSNWVHRGRLFSRIRFAILGRCGNAICQPQPKDGIAAYGKTAEQFLLRPAKMYLLSIAICPSLNSSIGIPRLCGGVQSNFRLTLSAAP
jgi:hypothetical protein